MPSPRQSRLRLIPIVLTQIIGFACGLASIRLNSHLVPPEVLGLYGIFLTFVPIGSGVLYAGLMKFVGRHWAAAPHRGTIAREVAAVWARRLPWLLAIAALASLGLPLAGITDRFLVGLALFTATSALSFTALTQTALQAEGAHWRDCLVGASGSLTRSFLPPLLYTVTGGLAGALCAGFGLHAFLAALAGGWALRAAWVARAPAHPPARELTPVYQGPLFVSVALASWTLAGLNRWLVASQFGETEAGYYTLAGGAAVIVTGMLGTVMMQYLQPGLYALGDGPVTARPGLARRVDLSALGYGVLAFSALLSVHALFPLLVGPLISPAYRDSVRWLVPAGCFGVATMTAVFYHIMLLAGRRERSCAAVDLTTAAVLAGGCIVGALAGPGWLARWLLATPLVAWLLTRTLARHYFFKPAADPTLSPAP